VNVCEKESKKNVPLMLVRFYQAYLVDVGGSTNESIKNINVRSHPLPSTIHLNIPLHSLLNEAGRQNVRVCMHVLVE
jgi:hypothetical protein